MTRPQEPQPAPESRKRTYVPPEMIEYGNIVMITRGTAGAPLDGADGIDDPVGTV